MNDERNSADWMSILLHGLLGFVLGGGTGFAAALQGAATPFAMPFLILGAALVGAGLGAKRGDRQWLGDNAGSFGMGEIRQTSFSRGLILTAKILGGLLIACGIAIDLWIRRSP